jgi:cysteinyl-tRNA synthetase
VYDEIMGMLALDEHSDGVADLADLIGEIAERHGAADNVDALLDRREQARTSGDFEAGDSIRDELAAIGIVVEDTADGARWHRR